MVGEKPRTTKDVELERLSERIFSIFRANATLDDGNAIDVSSVLQKLNEVPLERVSKALHLLGDRELIVQLPEKTDSYRLTDTGRKSRPIDLIASRLKDELGPAEQSWRTRRRLWWCFIFSDLGVLAVALAALAALTTLAAWRWLLPVDFILFIAAAYVLLILFLFRDEIRDPSREVQLPIRLFHGFEYISGNELKKAQREFNAAASILRRVRVIGWKSISRDVRSLFATISLHIGTGILGPIAASEDLTARLPTLLNVIDELAHPSLAGFQKAAEEIASLPERVYEPKSWWRPVTSSTFLVFLLDVGISTVAYCAILSSGYSKDAALISTVAIFLGVPVIWFGINQSRQSG